MIVYLIFENQFDLMLPRNFFFFFLSKVTSIPANSKLKFHFGRRAYIYIYICIESERVVCEFVITPRKM